MPLVSSQFGMWDSTTHLLWFHIIFSMLYCAAFSHFIGTLKQETRSIFCNSFFLFPESFCMNKPNQNEVIKKRFACVNGEHGGWACCCCYSDYTLITETLCNLGNRENWDFKGLHKQLFTCSTHLPLQSMYAFISAMSRPWYTDLYSDQP